jgi:MATE family multidrug resistance protein
MIGWVGLAALFLPALFASIGVSGQLYSDAVAYAYARLPGAPALVIEFALGSFFHGVGLTRAPLLAQFVGFAVNAVASVVLVFGWFGAPALGVAGAGIAHSSGNLAVALTLSICFLSRTTRRRYGTSFVGPDVAALLRFAKSSAPNGGQWLLDMGMFAVFTSIVASLGPASIAASQVLLQLLSLSFMQALAIGTASGTLVGRYLGASDAAAARRSFHSAQLLALCLGALGGLLMWSMPATLIGLFTVDQAVIALCRPLLQLGAVFQILDAVGIVACGALRGAGDTRWPFLVQATLAWLVRLPLVYWVAIVLKRGAIGAWTVELGYSALVAALMWGRFRQGRWKTAQI